MRELIRMKIRKYFYSEYKKKLDERWKELGAVLEAQKERISRLSPEEQEEIRERNIEEIQRLMEDLMPLPSEAYTFINITKYELFCTLAKSCVHYARREYANLLVDVEAVRLHYFCGRGAELHRGLERVYADPDQCGRRGTHTDFCGCWGRRAYGYRRTGPGRILV